MTDSDMEHIWQQNGFVCGSLMNGFDSPCGYVRIPHTHPWASMGMDEIPAVVHGGLSFKENDNRNPQYCWIGFDCWHWGDYSTLNPGGKVWSREEHMAETNRLANQAWEAAKAHPPCSVCGRSEAECDLAPCVDVEGNLKIQ